ncbi:hypothetical protein HI914_00309 [Erysiphe necator]|nr:hypothetical protein HI914_00309 [Erysiphe necator]
MQPIASEVAEEFYQSPVRPTNKVNQTGKSHFLPVTPTKHMQIPPIRYSQQLKHRQYQNNFHKQQLSKLSKTPCQLPIHKLANLSKTYRDEDRYSGAEHSFELCLGIFYDTCRRTGVQTQFLKILSLRCSKGQLESLTIRILTNSNLTFDEMITRLRAHFETAERQEQMLSKWKNLSLQRLIEENPTISYAEFFEILVKDIRRTQLSLPNRYQGDESLRDAIVDAVRDVRECAFACFKPAATVEALCADIRASIATEERLHKTKLTYQNRPQGVTINDQMYTDRYYKRMRSKSSSKNSDIQKYTKRCFVCKREKCWSSDHTKEKREKAKDAFRERLRSKMKPHDDRRIQQYIIECEGEQEDSSFEV